MLKHQLSDFGKGTLIVQQITDGTRLEVWEYQSQTTSFFVKEKTIGTGKINRKYSEKINGTFQPIFSIFVERLKLKPLCTGN